LQQRISQATLSTQPGLSPEEALLHTREFARIGFGPWEKGQNIMDVAIEDYEDENETN
jgi:hypothetical protein